MIYGRIKQGLPGAFEEGSSCSHTEMCSTAVLDSVLPHRFLLDHHDTMYLNIPLHMHFQGRKETWPTHCLVLEINEVFDDSSTKYVDVVEIGKIAAGLHGGVASMSGPPLPKTPMSTSSPGNFPATITAAGPGGSYDDIVKNKETPEECLHYSCKYAFIDCSDGALVCYGTVSAEGCSTGAERYGPNGVWAVSLRELVTQITEDTPYKMKNLDAKDFH
jgi:hypothetical protein